jgi:hypothetical protein
MELNMLLENNEEITKISSIDAKTPMNKNHLKKE